MCITRVTPFLAAKALLESLEHSTRRGSTMDVPFISKGIRLPNEMCAEGCTGEPNRSRGLATFPADYFSLLKHKKVSSVLSNDSCYILKLKENSSPGAEETLPCNTYTQVPSMRPTFTLLVLSDICTYGICTCIVLSNIQAQIWEEHRKTEAHLKNTSKCIS